jgi:hypothetical protein
MGGLSTTAKPVEDEQNVTSMSAGDTSSRHFPGAASTNAAADRWFSALRTTVHRRLSKLRSESAVPIMTEDYAARLALSSI